MAVKIRAARMSDLKAYHACFDAVARERVHLGMVAAPPLEGSRGWMRMVLGAKCPFYVAVDGKRIVGWCDAGPREMEGFRHTVGLGMGLLPEARRRGLGARLVKKAIAHCRRRRIEKIELQVYASNRAARALYRKLGFKQEGRRVRARKLDGKYDDVILMGKLL
jgi:ribosomal protein S18 acetylase RimI-like enzyme